MHTRSTRLLFAALALIGFASCKKEFSDDTPLVQVQQASLYITSQAGVVYALDSKTGGKRWEFDAGAPVSSTPYLLRNQVFICSEDGYMHKVNALTGKEVRRYNLSVGSPNPLVASPVGEGDFIYVGADDEMFCYDINADTIRWKTPVGGYIRSSATFSDTNVVFGCDDQQLYCMSKRYGNMTWQFGNPDGGRFSSSPTVRRGMVYVGGEDGSMYAVRAADGIQRWAYKTGGPIQSSPISYGGNIIFGSYDKNVYCIDSGSGLPRWIFPTTDRVTSSPYAYNQVIYVGSYDFNLYAIHIITGAQKWKVRTNALIKSSPIAADGTVYYASYDKFLYAADTAVGVTKWKRSIDGVMDVSPVLADSMNKGLYPAISGGSLD